MTPHDDNLLKKSARGKVVTHVHLPENAAIAKAVAGDQQEHYTLLETAFGCQIRRRGFTLSISSLDGAAQNINHDKIARAINDFIALQSTKKNAGYKDMIEIINHIGIPDIIFNSHNPHTYKAETTMAKKDNPKNKAKSKPLPAYQRAEANQNNTQNAAEPAQPKGDMIVNGIKGGIHAKTENHKKLVKAVEAHDVVFATGQAGTGKTYIGVALAAKAFKEKSVDKIIITRPAVEAEEKLGFLPGDLKEKVDPYMQPIYDALNDIYDTGQIEKMLENKDIEVAPIAFMRGRTLDNAFVILDEAQNTTKSQMKMFLTRMGKRSKYYITGDVTQIDLPRHKDSGLRYAKDALSQNRGIKFVELDGSDTMRHPLVESMIANFDNFDEKYEAQQKAAHEAKKAEQAARAANQNNFAKNNEQITASKELAAEIAAPSNGNGNGLKTNGAHLG